MSNDFSVIRAALIAAPVYVTKDGVWLNLRPDAERHKGGAMFKIEGVEEDAIRAYGEKINAALIALSRLESEKQNSNDSMVD